MYNNNNSRENIEVFLVETVDGWHKNPKKRMEMISFFRVHSRLNDEKCREQHYVEMRETIWVLCIDWRVSICGKLSSLRADRCSCIFPWKKKAFIIFSKMIFHRTSLIELIAYGKHSIGCSSNRDQWERNCIIGVPRRHQPPVDRLPMSVFTAFRIRYWHPIMHH